MSSIDDPNLLVHSERNGRMLSKQTISDNEKLSLRIKRCRTNIFMIDRSMVKNDGKKMTMNELYNVATYIGSIIHRKVDRLARRNRKGLLCWLSESCEILAKNKSLLLAHYYRQQVVNFHECLQTFINNQKIQTTQEEAQTKSEIDENINTEIPCEIPCETPYETPYDNESINLETSYETPYDNDSINSIQKQLLPGIQDSIRLPPLINNNNELDNSREILSLINI